jgi:hypothetical protein
MPDREARTFSRQSPVGAYWLRNCAGFEVRTGRRTLGVVTDVGVAGPLGHAHTLTVRTRRRERLLDAAQVLHVVPEHRLLLARRPQSAVRRRAVSPIGTAALGVGRAAVVLATAVARASAVGARAARVAALRVIVAGARIARRQASVARVAALRVIVAGARVARRQTPLVRIAARHGRAAVGALAVDVRRLVRAAGDEIGDEKRKRDLRRDQQREQRKEDRERPAHRRLLVLRARRARVDRLQVFTELFQPRRAELEHRSAVADEPAETAGLHGRHERRIPA